ncbi:MAG: SH3 domain-containing protein [Chloroflexia bacterium]|nr:SH3 domain-containing protein [Chloroflexia bacterium]
MTSSPRRAVSRLRMIMIVALAVVASPVVPAANSTFAQSALGPGAVGLVANTGGDPVLLRETPSFDAAVLSSFPEGTAADILEGPLYSEEGTAWLGVSVGGATGYIVAGYLVDSGQTADPATVEMAQEAAPAETAATETMAAEAIPAAPAPVAAATTSDIPVNPIATTDLNLRAGPSFGDAVLTLIPAGAALTATGEWSQGFAGVTYGGQYGWVDSSLLGAGESAPQAETLALATDSVPETAPAPVAEMAQVADAASAPTAAPASDAGVIGDLATAPAGSVAYAADTANLRIGPSESDAVLRVLPAGGAVTITGESSNGWTPVWYNGTWGFISDSLLSAETTGSLSLAQNASPLTPTAPIAADGAGDLQATTTSDINVRAAPDFSAMVLGTIPAGAALTPLAGPEQGFYQIAYGQQTGWVSGEYLDVSSVSLQRANRDERDGKVEGSAPADGAELGAGGIIWPVSGGLWYIMQGYHGSSHQNQSGLWQYEYSLDLARRDGNTAGQQVISPVNGEVRWTDPSTGGISIDIGNGHAVAMFHVDFMNGLEAGTAVRQGQYLGEISGPGGPGFAGTPHLHFTLWATNDNGNWDRQAVPFTGPYAIDGMDFPDAGGTHQGVEFSP